MNRPLPQRMYLLGCAVDGDRPVIAAARFRGELMRAAALAELSLRGLVTYRRGKAAGVPGTSVDDPFLASVLRYAPADRPRRWVSLISHDAHTAEAFVRGQLAEAGAVSVDPRNPLQGAEVLVRDREAVRGLRNEVRDAVIGGRDVAELPVDRLLTAVLAAEAEVDTVLTLSERWTHRKRLKSLAAHVEPVAPGLTIALRTANATARSYNGGWS
ncbi:hypothetical protein Val02_30820 [Virgisporangium aliadipatigenens]|uniref:GPP34 family phosphoprotein n=1 Tax=Virgisporangium aliadipatigenens TaxID=741659 RepID=A0A8J4DQN8_9ACTN|nr:GPP34 family phosphoprotein [Virgisporangium aliadipatigenens]GIJ46196.1 hypothetical protein Val02_30820 [Virgisporangium aliadipatigenens]